VVWEKVVTPVQIGVPKIYNELKRINSGACPGPDPGFAEMTKKRIFRIFTNSSFLTAPEFLILSAFFHKTS
jgi:hypothetical protein